MPLVASRSALFAAGGCRDARDRRQGSKTAARPAICALTVLALLVASCATPEPDAGERPSLEGLGHLEQASISCDSWVTTGYVDGNPFEITLITVDGMPVQLDTGSAFYVMQQAAAADGVNVIVGEGFRTWDEQAYYYNCYNTCSCNDCNPAAQPGYSNHQSGHALDLNTASGGVLGWLNANGGNYGFAATVAGEDWHWEWWGGGPGGGPCGNIPPRGSLDGAGCEAVSGWGQDVDQPDTVIAVHVYFDGPAGAPGARGLALAADLARDDLCRVLGSCNHGFALPTPLGALDGLPHEVHAYGIDGQGGANAELANSPRTLQCAPSAPAGYRRHVVNLTSYAAWRFSDFEDILPIGDAAVDALPEGPPVPDAPVLVRADAAPEIYLIDGDLRRHVPGPAVFTAWRFDWNAVEVRPAAEVLALPEGLPLRPRVVLVRHSSGAVSLIDDVVAAAPDGGPPDEGMPDTGSAEERSSDAGKVEERSPDAGVTEERSPDAGVAEERSPPDASAAEETSPEGSSSVGCVTALGRPADGRAALMLALLALAAVLTRRLL